MQQNRDNNQKDYRDYKWHKYFILIVTRKNPTSQDPEPDKADRSAMEFLCSKKGKVGGFAGA
jgi:hypothetical protein